MRQGAKDFLVKPVRAKDLIAKVAATTGRLGSHAGAPAGQFFGCARL